VQQKTVPHLPLSNLTQGNGVQTITAVTTPFIGIRNDSEHKKCQQKLSAFSRLVLVIGRFKGRRIFEKGKKRDLVIYNSNQYHENQVLHM